MARNPIFSFGFRRGFVRHVIDGVAGNDAADITDESNKYHGHFAKYFISPIPQFYTTKIL